MFHCVKSILGRPTKETASQLAPFPLCRWRAGPAVQEERSRTQQGSNTLSKIRRLAARGVATSSASSTDSIRAAGTGFPQRRCFSIENGGTTMKQLGATVAILALSGGLALAQSG